MLTFLKRSLNSTARTAVSNISYLTKPTISNFNLTDKSRLITKLHDTNQTNQSLNFHSCSSPNLSNKKYKKIRYSIVILFYFKT